MKEVTIKSEPKCPSCAVVGIEYISSGESSEQSKSGDAWFNIVYCNQCGHIHGIFNKVSLSPTINMKLP